MIAWLPQSDAFLVKVKPVDESAVCVSHSAAHKKCLGTTKPNRYLLKLRNVWAMIWNPKERVHTAMGLSVNFKNITIAPEITSESKVASQERNQNSRLITVCELKKYGIIQILETPEYFYTKSSDLWKFNNATHSHQLVAKPQIHLITNSTKTTFNSKLDNNFGMSSSTYFNKTRHPLLGKVSTVIKRAGAKCLGWIRNYNILFLSLICRISSKPRDKLDRGKENQQHTRKHPKISKIWRKLLVTVLQGIFQQSIYCSRK